MTLWDCPCGCKGVEIQPDASCTGVSVTCEEHADAGLTPDGSRDWTAFMEALRAWCGAHQDE